MLILEHLPDIFRESYDRFTDNIEYIENYRLVEFKTRKNEMELYIDKAKSESTKREYIGSFLFMSHLFLGMLSYSHPYILI